MNRQIGRILQQNQRAAARFAVRLEEGGGSAGFRLAIVVKPSFDAWAALSKGAYLLRSNIADWREEQLRKAYPVFADWGKTADPAFAELKDKRCRPNGLHYEK